MGFRFLACFSYCLSIYVIISSLTKSLTSFCSLSVSPSSKLPSSKLPSKYAFVLVDNHFFISSVGVIWISIFFLIFSRISRLATALASAAAAAAAFNDRKVASTVIASALAALAALAVVIRLSINSTNLYVITNFTFEFLNTLILTFAFLKKRSNNS